MLQISFQHLLEKQGGKRAAWEYPFAVAGVNVTFMIMQMLDLDACEGQASDFVDFSIQCTVERFSGPNFMLTFTMLSYLKLFGIWVH